MQRNQKAVKPFSFVKVALLNQLDISPGELLVKAVVYEVSTDRADKSAMSLAASLVGGRLLTHLLH